MTRRSRRVCNTGKSRVLEAGVSSVNADRLQFIAPGVGNRSFPAIGQHDRSAVGGVEREQLQARGDLWRLREKSWYILGADLLHIGDVAFAQGRQCLG